MWVLTHVTGMEHRLFHSVTHGVPLENLLDRAVLLGLNLDGGVGVQGWGGGGSGRVVLIDNGRVNQSKAADALVQVKTTKFGTNVGLNMLLNISSRYFGGLFWSRQLRGLPSSDGYFVKRELHYTMKGGLWWCFESGIGVAKTFDINILRPERKGYNFPLLRLAMTSQWQKKRPAWSLQAGWGWGENKGRWLPLKSPGSQLWPAMHAGTTFFNSVNCK